MFLALALFVAGSRRYVRRTPDRNVILDAWIVIKLGAANKIRQWLGRPATVGYAHWIDAGRKRFILISSAPVSEHAVLCQTFLLYTFFLYTFFFSRNIMDSCPPFMSYTLKV